MKCKKCSKEFIQNSNSQKFCGECKIKICKSCGKSFSIANLGNGNYKGLYCSMICYHKDRWGNEENKCKNCGKELKNNQARFCDKICQKDFWNKQGYHFGAKKRYWKRKLALIEKIGGECKSCGNKDIRVLDLNHIDREQKKRPPKRAYNWTRRLKEWEGNPENLEILCANCHRMHTWEQMGYGVGLDEAYFKIAQDRIGV